MFTGKWTVSNVNLRKQRFQINKLLLLLTKAKETQILQKERKDGDKMWAEKQEGNQEIKNDFNLG